jgi:bacteriocin-like protein
MKNFEELSFEEMQRVEGGLPWLVYGGYLLGVAAVALATDVIMNWDGYVEAINSGYDSGFNAGVSAARK